MPVTFTDERRRGKRRCCTKCSLTNDVLDPGSINALAFVTEAFGPITSSWHVINSTVDGISFVNVWVHVLSAGAGGDGGAGVVFGGIFDFLSSR